MLKWLDDRLAKKGGEYFADNRLTIADLKVLVFVQRLCSDMLDHIPTSLVQDTAPALLTHLERVTDDPASLFSVIGTLGVAGRDLATRAAPPVLSNVQLGIYGFFILIVSGLILQLYSNDPLSINTHAGVQIFAAVIFGVAAYNCLTIAMRSGDVSVVAPFRYTRLLFALVLGIVIFAERPDIMTLSGGFIIVLSGGFILLQSRRVHVLKVRVE